MYNGQKRSQRGAGAAGGGDEIGAALRVKARAAVLEHLSSGEGTEEDTAKQLHMSARTLQRKLAEAKTTYLQLVDDTRKDLALRYIEDAARSVADIAFTLGFSQQSAFTRAFRRWTGRAPSEMRAS